jgi:ABC-2 type transport system permease protein
MVAGGMGKYSGYAAGGQTMNELINQMPKAVQAIININYFDLSKASGFYGALFPYLVIMAVIHAAMLGSNIISKEERDKTAEFLFVKPVSRSKVITSKLAASFVNILILNIITLASSISVVGYLAKGEAINHDIFILMVGMLILQLIFFFMGTGIASFSKNPHIAPPLSTGILLAAFVISKAIDINTQFDILKYFTPFKYYEAKDLMYGGGFDAVYLIISFLLIAVFAGLTYTFYKKRDLNI